MSRAHLHPMRLVGCALLLAFLLVPGLAAARLGGPATFEVVAGDASDALPVLVEQVPPDIQITSPANGSVIAGGAVTLTGTVADIADPFDPAPPPTPLYGEVRWVLINAELTRLAEGAVPLVDGHFTIPDVALGEGPHYFDVYTVDAGGILRLTSLDVVSDPNAAPVALVSPPDGSAVLTSSVPVDLNFAEATTLVAVNGVPDGRLLGPGLVAGAFTLPLALGPNVVTLELEGSSGPFNFSFTVFRVESIDPPRITSIQDGGFTNDSTLTVTGTVPLGTPYVAVNGVRATIDGAAFTAEIPLREGDNTISVVAYPQADLTQIHVTLDTRPPGIHFVIPDDGTLTLDAEVLIAAMLDESARVEVTGPSGQVSGNTRVQFLGTFPAQITLHLAELDPLTLSDGANDLVLTATDRAGNQTVVDLLVTKTGAALALSSPADGSAIPALRVEPVVEALADVTIDALYSGALRVPGFEGATLSTGLVPLPAIPLVPGTNEIRIVYHRTGGAQEVVRFAYQSTASDAMTVTGVVRNGETGAAVGGALVSISVNGLTMVAVTGTDGGYVVRTEAGNATVVAMAEGYSTESAAGSGDAGDTVVADLDLDDTGIPGLVNEVAIVVPPAGTVTDFEKLTVVGTVLNPLSAVSVNGIAAEVVGHRFTACHVPLAMGANTISVNATALGALPATASVAVQRATEPVLAVKIFSPPAGATIPGGGLVVRGFVSGKDAAVRIDEEGFVAVEEGVFQANDITRPAGEAKIRADASTLDGLDHASSQVLVSFASAEPALSLFAAPPSGPSPLAVTLSLASNVGAFEIERIDFDVDGDGEVEIAGSESTEATASYDDPALLVARGFVTTPQQIELSAPSQINVHLPHQILREFAQGNPVDLAARSDGGFYVLDGAAGRVHRYDLNGSLIDSFGSSGAGPSQLSNPQAIAVAPDGRIFVADTGNDRIQVYAEDGLWDRTLTSAESVMAPRGIAVVDDRIVVYETGANRVRVFDSDGETLASAPIASPRGIVDLSGFGAVIASPAQGLRSLIGNTLTLPPGLDALPISVGSMAPVDVAVGDRMVLVADASRARTLVLSPRLSVRRSVESLGAAPLAVLPSARREVESFYVADGMKVAEIGIPAMSPLPVVQELKSELLAGDVSGALSLIHPAQRGLFEEIYTAIGSELPADAALMTQFEVDLLREDVAIVRILTIENDGGTIRESSAPVYLVRMEDGSWRVFDY